MSEDGLPSGLIHALEELGYLQDEGLVTSRLATPSARDRSWVDLHDRVGVQAVYFQDGAPVVAFASAGGGGLRALRRRLWNFGRVPLLINAGDEQVTVYSARDFNNAYIDGVDGMLATADSTELQLLRAFQASSVDAGDYSSLLSDGSYSNSVDRALLRNLAHLRGAAGVDGASMIAIDYAVGGAILARYLEDRQVLSSARVDAMCGHPTVIAAFEDGPRAVRALFGGLAEHFNGDVFGAFAEAIPGIAPAELASVGRLVAGDDLATGQGALWPYDFAIIPADLVSSIYEQLLESDRRRSATYYTPRFLVDIILDEVLPQDSPEQESRVLDLACGSGAFLTEAFRRLIYLRIATDNDDGTSTYNDLVRILRLQIFGVDINEVAARITVFGLYLALLEHVDPPTIWEDVRLPRLLGANVLVADAFDNLGIEHFDVVVGNPPWASRLSKAAANFVRDGRGFVADNQIAEAFVWRALELLRPGGILAQALPAKPVLHNRGRRAAEFRKRLFSSAVVLSVIDLSAIRRWVFTEAIAPCAVLVAQKPDESSDAEQAPSDVLHLAAHPRRLSSALNRLVVTPEEIRSIPRGVAARPDIWKPLLWGTLRDVDLLDHLAVSYPSLGDWARQGEWLVGQGYQVGGGDEADASQLLGMPNVRQNAVWPLFLDEQGVDVFERQGLHRVRSVRMYKAPLVLLKRTLVNRRVAAVMVERDVTYSNALVGVSADEEDLPLLAAFAAAAVSSLGMYWFFHTSSSWGVERDFIEVNEFKSLPVPEPTGTVLDRLLTIHRAARSGAQVNDDELDDLVFDLFKLSVADRDRVRRGVAEGPERFAAGLSGSAPASPEELSAYRTTFAQSLRSLLPELRPTVAVGVEGSFGYVRIVFRGGDTVADAALPVSDVLTTGRVSTPQSSGLIAQLSGLYLDGNVVNAVKTLDRDRWSAEAALDDVDRVVAMLTTGEVRA